MPVMSRPPLASAKTARMIRVDHAGEYGATRIYAGQLAVLGHGAKGDALRHMQSQEQHHLSTFSALIADRRVRPTALLPIWHLAGFALGAITAALGEKVAMACTVAVEDAIEVHYRAQVDAMDDSESDLRETVEKFRAEELEHRDLALANGAEQMIGYRLLTAAIRAGCRAAIAVSERV
jgi:ubiquinone biosynthesis monooxygenase Coq7